MATPGTRIAVGWRRHPSSRFAVSGISGRSAAEWRDNPQAADQIDARLRRRGFDDSAVNAELFCQARAVFGMFDDLMHAAQNRRLVLLREINSRRELSQRLAKFQSRPDARRTQILNQH